MEDDLNEYNLNEDNLNEDYVNEDNLNEFKFKAIWPQWKNISMEDNLNRRQLQ